MAVTHQVRPRVLDTWMALLAGDRVWHDRSDGPPTGRERAAAGIMVGALFLVVLVQWVAVVTRADLVALGELSPYERDLAILAVIGMLAATALAIPPTRLIAGTRSGSANFWWSLCWRGVAYLALIATTAGMLPRSWFLGAIPIGLVGGADALLTMWALGLTPRPGPWLQRLVLSPVHFGALGALIGTIVFDPDGPSTRTAFGAYLAMWTGIVVAASAVLITNRVIAVADAQREEDRAELRERERELRVHWLHDDVLSEVKLASLRIESGGDARAAERELHELDHRLRVRQLEELLRGGRPHLYEIIQPHLRRAQALGIRLDRVPSLDRTSRRVDETTGQLVHRAVSNLVSNALNAGATRLSLTIEERHDPPSLEISVTDDAGGFSLDTVDPGRGLSLLMRDLGRDAVRRADAPGGSIVSVRIPLDPTSPPRPQEATPT